jgi:hypothetical protein
MANFWPGRRGGSGFFLGGRAIFLMSEKNSEQILVRKEKRNPN